MFPSSIFPSRLSRYTLSLSVSLSLTLSHSFHVCVNVCARVGPYFDSIHTTGTKTHTDNPYRLTRDLLFPLGSYPQVPLDALVSTPAHPCRGGYRPTGRENNERLFIMNDKEREKEVTRVSEYFYYEQQVVYYESIK